MSKDTQRIEIVFPMKVDISERPRDLIHQALSVICEENCPEDSLMWPSGHGFKPTFIPLTQYEEQFRGMEFDETVEYFEVSCREASSKELERKVLKKAEATKRGEWQKLFVGELVDLGITHDLAMKVMGKVCDIRQKVYMQGYDKGWAAALKDKIK